LYPRPPAQPIVFAAIVQKGHNLGALVVREITPNNPLYIARSYVGYGLCNGPSAPEGETS